METSLFFLIQPEVNYPRNGSLEIDFPAQFSFNETSFKCEFIIGFTDYDENTKGYCFKNKSSILVLNSFYSSVTSPLIFVIHGVLNPNSTAVTNSFYFQTTDQNTNVICKSYTNYSFSATPGNLTLLENPYRNINLAGSPFYLIVKVLNTNPFPKGGFVKIWVPLEQGILIDNNVSCGFYVSNAVASIQNCEVVNQTMGVEFWITEWCSYTSSCPKRSNLTFAINSGLINPYFISQDVYKSFF